MLAAVDSGNVEFEFGPPVEPDEEEGITIDCCPTGIIESVVDTDVRSRVGSVGVLVTTMLVIDIEACNIGADTVGNSDIISELPPIELMELLRSVCKVSSVDDGVETSEETAADDEVGICSGVDL